MLDPASMSYRPAWPPAEDVPLDALCKPFITQQGLLQNLLSRFNEQPKSTVLAIFALHRFQAAWRFRPVARMNLISPAAATADVMLWGWRSMWLLLQELSRLPQPISPPCLWCGCLTLSWCSTCNETLCALCASCKGVSISCPRCAATHDMGEDDYKRPISYRLRRALVDITEPAG